jgi:phage-related baseplate assembly protein
LEFAGNGVPADETIDAVELILNGEEVTPLTDTVIVQKATPLNYLIDAALTYQEGADQAQILANSLASVETYKQARRNLGLGVSLSGLYAALHVTGVENVVITSPASAIACDSNETAFCTSVAVV